MTVSAILPHAGMARVLICDLIGLAFDANGKTDHGEVKAHVEARGGVFHEGPLGTAGPLEEGRVHFFYLPDLSTREDLIAEAGDGRYDAVIAAATFMPAETCFPLGGVRIGAGTGNMGSRSWGGGNGEGGTAPLMNTPGINSRATAQMAMKAVLRVLPDLPVANLNRQVQSGDFDTGRQLRDVPTAKLEGKRFGIVGYGNIGRELAKLARAFGMEVVVHARAHHREWIEAEGFVYAETPLEAARGAHVFSVHVGLGNLDAQTGRYANAGLVDAKVLAALAEGAVLVNYDRGELVDVEALAEAMAVGRIAHAAIDADLFKDAATGALSGPMLPYISLVERFGGRLELLPHAAADTDHPSRVAGARQAVDQILMAIRDRRVVNLKGSLPDGYEDGGTDVPAGIGGTSAEQLARIAGDGTNAESLAEQAEVLSAFWKAIVACPSAEERERLIGKQGRDMMLAANKLATLLQDRGLSGPFKT